MIAQNPLLRTINNTNSGTCEIQLLATAVTLGDHRTSRCDHIHRQGPLSCVGMNMSRLSEEQFPPVGSNTPEARFLNVGPFSNCLSVTIRSLGLGDRDQNAGSV